MKCRLMMLIIAVVFTWSSVFGQQCENACLQALKAAAYNENSIRKEDHSIQETKAAACEAVKWLKAGNESTKVDAFTSSFIARFRNQKQYWDEYESLFCSASSSFSSFDGEFSFWSKIVETKSLDTFLGCMRTCKSARGLSYESSIVDACNTGIKVVYVAPAGTAPKVSLKSAPTFTNASCSGLPAVNKTFDEHGFSCKIKNRKPGLVTLNTSKGSLLIPLAGVPDPQPPDAPLYIQVYEDKDDKGTPYIAKFQLDTDIWTPAHHCRVCSGTFDLPQGARIPDESYVSYACIAGACGWSYNTHLQSPHEYDPDVTVNGNQVIWRRHWQGDRVIELYTIRYQMPRTKCTSNCDYDKKLAEYEQLIKTDPCASGQMANAGSGR